MAIPCQIVEDSLPLGWDHRVRIVAQGTSAHHYKFEQLIERAAGPAAELVDKQEHND